MLREPAALIAALDDTLDATITLCKQLAPDDWAKPTGCPGWSVQDNVSHIVGLERVLLGDPEPAHDLPPDLPHIANDMQRYMEMHVDARRSAAPEDLIKELEVTAFERIAMLRSLAPEEFDAERPGVMGMPSTLTRFLPIRVFDVFAHEQDIRRATGHAGHLDSAPGAHSRDIILGAMRRLAEQESISLQISVTGAGGATLDASIDGTPATTLTTDVSNFIALGCGRCDADKSAVAVDGDPLVGERILGAIAVTP